MNTKFPLPPCRKHLLQHVGGLGQGDLLLALLRHLYVDPGGTGHSSGIERENLRKRERGREREREREKEEKKI